MSIATSAIAEAYVMRKHFQEKMKKTSFNAHGTTNNIIHDDDNDDDKRASTIGCFPTLFSKIHPTSSKIVTKDMTTSLDKQ
ncbi:hypothetical protein R6Q57_026752 [Mikania cordata]